MCRLKWSFETWIVLGARICALQILKCDIFSQCVAFLYPAIFSSCVVALRYLLLYLRCRINVRAFKLLVKGSFFSSCGDEVGDASIDKEDQVGMESEQRSAKEINQKWNFSNCQLSMTFWGVRVYLLQASGLLKCYSKRKENEETRGIIIPSSLNCFLLQFPPHSIRQ